MTWISVRRSTLSSSALVAGVALLFAACSDGGDSPEMPGVSGATTNGGSASGSGTVAGSGGSISGSSPGGSGGATAGTATGGAGSANGGTGGGGGAAGASGGSGTGGMSGGAGGTSGGAGGNGGAAGAAGGSGGATGGGSGGAAGSAGAGGGGGAPGFDPCPATGACKIMPFGDSITQGFNVAGGYRAPLFHLALAAQKEITFVGSANDYSVPTVDGMTFPRNHEGHGGFTIEGNNGIAKFVGTSIPSYKPHIITLMIGTNDLNGNNNVADAPNRLGKLLDSIFTSDPKILVVLAQIVPTRTDNTNNTVKTYNAAMPSLVTKQVAKGQHVVLVDMYTAFTTQANYKQAVLGDNLHPNQAGYDLMAKVWFEALNPYLH